MKNRITVFVFCILLVSCSLGYASEDSTANSYSEYELIKLFNEVSKKTPEVVRIPAGLYIVGKDLPSGVYTILKNSEVAQNTDNDISHVAVYSSMEEYNKDPDNFFDDDSCTLIACNTFWNGFSYELTDGMILYVKMGKAGITKHSRNLFAAFWEKEDGQASAVDLLSVIRSGSQKEHPVENENDEELHIIVESSTDWNVTKKYEYNDKYGYNCFIVFKHTLPVDQKTTVKFTFYDSSNNIIGETEDYVGCTGCDFDYIASGRNKTEYKYVVASISSTDLNRTTNCMDGIKVSSSREDLKIIVTAENIGEKPISYCELDVLYFDEHKNLVDSSSTYLFRTDSEMKKGDIIAREIEKYLGSFDSYDLFYNAYNFGNK